MPPRFGRAGERNTGGDGRRGGKECDARRSHQRPTLAVLEPVSVDNYVALSRLALSDA